MELLPLAAMIMAVPLAQTGSARLESTQSFHDHAAERIAGHMRGRFVERGGVRLEGDVDPDDQHTWKWRRVSDGELRGRSGYRTPLGYRFHRMVRVDLDHDGEPDVVEMVEGSRWKALRISYGGGRRVLITARAEGRWTDQGLFAAGDDAVLVNYPESRAYFLFQRGRALRAEYVGD